VTVPVELALADVTSVVVETETETTVSVVVETDSNGELVDLADTAPDVVVVAETDLTVAKDDTLLLVADTMANPARAQ
jgi:hypothetical protein